MPERGYHHGDLRSALLNAAENLVRERGADGWSLREVSTRIGVSPSAAYHHFSSREALVSALADQVISRLGTQLGLAARRVRGADPQARLIAVGRGYLRWALDDPAVARLVFRARPEGPSDLAQPHPHDVLAAEFDRLVAAGGLAGTSRPGAEYVLWAAIHGLALLLVDGLVRLDGPRAVDQETERLVRAVLTGLAAETGESWPIPRTAYTDRRTPAG